MSLLWAQLLVILTPRLEMTEQPLFGKWSLGWSVGCHNGRKEEHGHLETDSGTMVGRQIVYLEGGKNARMEWEMQQGKEAARKGCVSSQLPLWVDETRTGSPRELVRSTCHRVSPPEG